MLSRNRLVDANYDNMVQWLAMEAKGKLAPYWRVLRLVWPLALGMANNAIMQFTDRVFLAQESVASLEAILPASMLAFVFVGFFQSLVTYSGTFVAQYTGAGKPCGATRSFHAGLALSALSAIVLAAFIPLGNQVFAWCGHSPEVLAREQSYYSIVMAGAFATCGMMTCSAFFTGLGRTRVVFWVNVGGNALNILLDYLLIFGFDSGFGFRIAANGMRGAAVATVTAQAFQFAALAWLAHRFISRMPKGEGECVDGLWSIMARILRFGTPAGLYSVLNIVSFTVFVFVTEKMGDMALAVSNAAFSVNWLLIAPIEGFGIGAGTLVGQHQGARDPDAAMADGTRALVLAELYVLVASAAVLIFHRPILELFAAKNAALDLGAFTSLGFTLFVLMVAWQFFDAADVTLSGALKGAGDTRFVMGWMLVCAFAVWMPLVFLVYWLYPTMPALWSTMIAYVVMICVGTWIRWHRGPWRAIRLV